MGEIISNPYPVKLFIGMLSQDISLFDEIKGKLKEVFGPLDLESPVWEWNHTDYYSKEMGSGLKRQFIFFRKLINPGVIPEIKLKTNELERQYLNENNPLIHPIIPPHPPLEKGERGDLKEGGRREFIGEKGRRRINLDPGYLDSAKIVLVSTKDFSHRIYLGNGIYGEVTLIYSGKNYQTLPYTYPDFRTQEYLDIFKKVREMYKIELVRCA